MLMYSYLGYLIDGMWLIKVCDNMFWINFDCEGKKFCVMWWWGVRLV